MNYQQARQVSWRNSWSFIAATAGATIGLGNLWKFSYLAGENGGGAFLLIYVASLLLVAMPVMLAELVIGSRGQADPITAVQDVSVEAVQHNRWQLIGWLGCVAGLLVLSYYSVIAGWSFAYVGKLFSGEFDAGSVQLAAERFQQLLADPIGLIKLQTGFLLVVAVIVACGVRRGIAAAARLLLPLLLITLAVLAIFAWQVGDFDAASDFLFRVDFSVVDHRVVLTALGHAFFTLSLGLGVMISFGAYQPGRRPLTGMVSVVVLVDTLVSLLAGLAIFPLVFALNVAPSMGPGLMFVAMPYGFGNMTSGSYYGGLFFLMVAMAAITSGSALLEPLTARLVKRYGWWRPFAAFAVAAAAWLLGLITLFSFNIWESVRIGGLSIFNSLDFLTANILLPLGGLLTALLVGWGMRTEVLRDELYNDRPVFFSLWYGVLRYIAAPGVMLVFGWSLYQVFL